MHHRADDGMAQARAFDMVGTHPLTSEARAAARSSLMLRMAKLVCQSGEYLCVVRDVSAEGVGLRFLHAVPPEPRIILTLANGATYPVERVWQGKQQAGFRFASPVEIDEFIHEPSPFASREVRLSIRTAAKVEAAGLLHDAEVKDLSKGGAMIASVIPFAVGSRVALATKGIQRRMVDVCWRRGDMHGLSFAEPMTTAELAEVALLLQPFEAVQDGGEVQAA